MEINQLFYNWVPTYVRYFILACLAFVSLCANGVFLGITTDMYSGTGEYTEPFTMAYNAMYIGMGLCMIFYVKLGTRFTNKTLVVSGLVSILLMNIICATTSSPTLTITACFVLGFTKVFTLGEVYLGWLKIWSKKLESARLYPFLYFLALAGLYFMTWLTAFLSHNFNWRYAYIAVCTMLLFCLILSVIFIENHSLKRKIPLYQADLPGLLLLATMLMLVNYVAVYGKVEDWFESERIILASFGAVILLILFIRRETSLKRPFFNFELFRKPNFGIGLLYFTLMGVFTPALFQSTFSGTILHFESITNSEVNLYLIPGIALGCLLSFFWYHKKYDGHLLMTMGFAAFVAYHIIMYNGFANDFSLQQFWLPSILKGIGFSLLYISIGLYTTAGFPFPTVLKVVGMIVIIRSFLSSGVMSGIYNYTLYAQRVKHLNYLASLSEGNEILLKSGAESGSFYRNIQTQATLTASKEISGYIIVSGFVLVLILLAVNLYQRANRWHKHKILKS